MEPQTGTALLILAAFVLPGFVTLRVRERTHVITEDVQPFKLLLQTLYYAAIVYAAAGFSFAAVGITGWLGKDDLVDIAHGHEPLGVLLAVATLVVLVLPMAVAEASRRWQKSGCRLKLLQKLDIDPGHEVDSGWNQAFRIADPSYVRVHLTDGRVLGGLFSGESLVGYSEHAGDLYLSRRVILDDELWFTEEAAGTLGLWLPRDQIASVEFYVVEDATLPEEMSATEVAQTANLET